MRQNSSAAESAGRSHVRDRTLEADQVRGFAVSAATLLAPREATETFVTRAQLRRVMAVFVPTLLFCLATQYLGMYVASFLLIAIFMRMVGRIALWKSLLTAFLFTAIMFVTFDIAFDVIMPKGPLEAAFGY